MCGIFKFSTPSSARQNQCFISFVIGWGGLGIFFCQMFKLSLPLLLKFFNNYGATAKYGFQEWTDVG